MKRSLVALLICLALVPVDASAQRRRRSTSKSSKPTAAAEAATAAERREAAGQLADQIKTLSLFLYLLGGITKTVEAADQAIRSSQASPEAIQQAERSKATVRESIRNVQVALDKIESDFSSKPSLRPYYQFVLGVTSYAATASRQAEAGQFDQAGRLLLKAHDRLTDALLAMQRVP